MLLGIGHYSRVGKDTLANLITGIGDEAGVAIKKLSFAWELKAVCAQLYGWAGLQSGSFYEEPANEHLRNKVLPDVGKTPVEIWHAVGNRIRDVYRDTWLKLNLENAKQFPNVSIPDVRFENEVLAIRELGGFTIKLVRPGVLPRNSISDQELIEKSYLFDYVLINDHDMVNLKRFAADWVSFVKGGPPPIQEPSERREALLLEQSILRGPRS